MPTPINIVATIEGAENVWRTTHDATSTDTDDRVVVSALKYEGITVSERSDLKTGTLEGDAITLSIVATPEANDEFSRRATLLTFLSSSVSTVGATTFNVRSNALLTDDTYVHVGTECVKITDASTLAVTVERAKRDTQAQVFLRDDGADANEIPVWSKVHAWEGRRVVIESTELGATHTAMRGVITQAPYLSADGTMWLIEVAHISAIMDQDAGAPTTATAGIRGLRFALWSAFGITIRDPTVTSFSTDYSVTGFYETWQEAETAINATVDTITYTGVTDIWYKGGRIFIRVGAADITQPFIVAGSGLFGIDKGTLYFWHAVTLGVVSSVPVTPGDALLAGSVYVRQRFGINQDYPGPKNVPRHMIYQRPTLGYDYPFENTAGGSNSVIYLDSDIGVTDNDVLILSGDTLPAELRVTVTALTGTLGYEFDALSDDLNTYCIDNGLSEVVLDATTVVRVQKALGVGSLYTFLESVVDAAPYANDGGTPYITAADLDTSLSAIEARVDVGVSSAFTDRNYNITEPVSFADVLAPELQLLGLMVATNSTGQIVLRTFDVLTPTTPYDVALDSDTIVTPHNEAGAWPGWITEANGVVSVVHMVAGKNVAQTTQLRTRRGRTAWRTVYSWLNPADPAVYIYRDVASLSAYKNKGIGTLEIIPEVAAKVNLTQAEAAAIGGRLVRFFGQPYETITVKARRTATTLAVRLGDVALITSPLIPNSADGSRGVSSRRGTVIGRTVSYEAAEVATVDFVVVMHGSAVGVTNIAGYAPSALITAATLVDVPGGNTWDCTIDQNMYAPTGSDDADFFAVGDYVRAVEYNDATPNTTNGTISTVSATNIRIAFTAAAPWGGAYSGTYNIEFALATVGMTDAQDDYCYTADSNIQLSNNNPARIFA